MFYPADAEELARDIQAFLAACEPAQAPAPKALIVPHAGYIYSGAVAASAYALMAPARSLVRRVVLLGPAHRVPIRGLALPVAEAFATPLGGVRIERVVVGGDDQDPHAGRSGGSRNCRSWSRW